MQVCGAVIGIVSNILYPSASRVCSGSCLCHIISSETAIVSAEWGTWSVYGGELNVYVFTSSEDSSLFHPECGIDPNLTPIDSNMGKHFLLQLSIYLENRVCKTELLLPYSLKNRQFWEPLVVLRNLKMIPVDTARSHGPRITLFSLY